MDRLQSREQALTVLAQVRTRNALRGIRVAIAWGIQPCASAHTHFKSVRAALILSISPSAANPTCAILFSAKLNHVTPSNHGERENMVARVG